MVHNRVSTTIFAVCALFALDGCITGDAPDDPSAGRPDFGSLTQDLALPPPTSVMSTAVSPNRIDIVWTPVTGDLQYYIVDVGPAPGAEVTLTSVPPDKTTWISPNLTPNTQYCWDIRTVDNSDEVSGRSPETCATTPATVETVAPTGLAATPISASRITVSWNAVAGAQVYHVFMAQGTTGSFSQIASVTTTSTTVANLQPASTYLFEVSVVTAGGESPPSAPVSAQTFKLGLEGYWNFDEVKGSVAKDSSGFMRNATLLTGTSFSTTPLPSVNLANRSTLSIPAASSTGATVTSVAPFRFAGADFSLSTWVKLGAATATDFVGIRASGCGALGWKLGQDPTNQLNIQGGGGTRSFGVSLAPGVWTAVAFTFNQAASSLTLYVSGAQVATTSYKATNSLGTTPSLTFGHVGGCVGGAAQLDELQIYSRTLSAAEISVLGAVPPPTALSVTVNNATNETLTWTAVPNADLYYVYKGTAAGNEVFFTSVPGNKTTFVGQHLTPLATNTWIVRATAGGLPFSISNEVSATTTDILPAPATVTATPLNATRISVTWSAVTGATSYKIYQSTSGGSFVQVGAVLTPITTMQVANLTTKTTYMYEVLAVDSGGNLGHLSTPVSATTP